MPTMADITVKANNGTTDVVYTAVVASGGDKSPARWRVETTALAVGNRSNAMCMSEATGSNARRVTFRGRYPVVRALNSVDTLIGTIPLEFTATIGQQYTQAEIDEAVSQMANLLVSALIKNSFKSGYAPV